MDDLALSDIKKAIQAVKRDKWRDAENIMRKMGRQWDKHDHDVASVISSFLHHAEEVGWEEEDDKKHEKLAVKILERLESAFKAGYPSYAGVDILKKVVGKNRRGTIATELLKVAESLTASETKELEFSIPVEGVFTWRTEKGLMYPSTGERVSLKDISKRIYDEFKHGVAGQFLDGEVSSVKAKDQRLIITVEVGVENESDQEEERVMYKAEKELADVLERMSSKEVNEAVAYYLFGDAERHQMDTHGVKIDIL